MTDSKTKNTLQSPQSTKPFEVRIPPKNPGFNQFKKPQFNVPKFNTAFRTQSRGSGGK